MTSITRSNDAYAWNNHYNLNRSHTINGLNQTTDAGPVTLTHDGRGNVITSGTNTYAYTSENLMKTATGGISLTYDAVGRLAQYDAALSTRFVYDGAFSAAEVANPSGAIIRRYVHGPGDDEPLVWYEGSSTGDRRWLHADERGSIIAVSNAAGDALAINRYDEYGIPATSNFGRFQYSEHAAMPGASLARAAQQWLPELGMSYYKARMYSYTLGRFMQTDPIGYGDGMNLYNYVGGDPVNFRDPSGLCGQVSDPCLGDDITVNGGGLGTLGLVDAINVGPGELINLPGITIDLPGIPAPDNTDTPCDAACLARFGPADFVSGGSGLAIQTAGESASEAPGVIVVNGKRYYPIQIITVSNVILAPINTINIQGYERILLATRFKSTSYFAQRGSAYTFISSYTIIFQSRIGFFPDVLARNTVIGRSPGEPAYNVFVVPPGANFVRFLPNILTGTADVAVLGNIF